MAITIVYLDSLKLGAHRKRTPAVQACSVGVLLLCCALEESYLTEPLWGPQEVILTISNQF